MTLPAGLRLRRAEHSDTGAVADVYIASRRGAVAYMPTIHTDDDIRRWIAAVMMPSLEVWVAEASGRILGFLALDGETLDQLFVAPPAQRNGIGDRLLAKAKELRPRRLQLFTFQKNAPARSFYEARGFVAIDFNSGERNEEREPDVLYQWTSGPGA